MNDFVTTLAVVLFLLGALLLVIYYVSTAIFAYRNIAEIDDFVHGFRFGKSDSIVYKFMRMCHYMPAGAWPFANRRIFPDRNFSELPKFIRVRLIFGFWLFLVGGTVFFTSFAIYFIFRDSIG